MADDKTPKSPWGKPQGGKGPGKGTRPTGANSPWGKPAGQPDRIRPKARETSSDLENIIEGFKRGGPRRAGGPRRPSGGGAPTTTIPPWLLGVGALALVLSSSIYTVQGNEQSAVLRFGDYVRTAGPGLNFKLPYPIETKITRAVTDQKEITVGTTDDESLMVTGDENIVDVQFTVLFVINELGDYLFEIEDPKDTVKATAESVVREVVGRNNLDLIITTERETLVAEVTRELQALLDEYQAGVEIIDVQFQRTDPPGQGVIEAFDRVVASAQEAEADINNARAELNRVTLEAEGRAAAILEEAQAYRDTVIAVSEGEAERFRAVYEEYRKAPEVTRRRIYLETIEEIYGDAEKVVLDGGEGGTGAVPYLPLNELGNRGGN